MSEYVIYRSMAWDATSNLSEQHRVLFLEASGGWYIAVCRPFGIQTHSLTTLAELPKKMALGALNLPHQTEIPQGPGQRHLQAFPRPSSGGRLTLLLPHDHRHTKTHPTV